MESKRGSFALSPAVLVIAAGIILGAGVFAWLTLSPRPGPPPEPVLTAEARAYLSNLRLSDVQPQTSESYIQQSLFEIMGKITNGGGRAVSSVRVRCVFRDFSGRELKRELAVVVGRRTGNLDPGATKAFRLAFDEVPESWNRQMPDFVIAEIRF